MNHFQFVIMLSTILFGGHFVLHHWDARQTRRAMLVRACRVPKFVARAWVEGRKGDASLKLWLQFTGGQPVAVARGGAGCDEVIARLRAAGITVDTSAFQTSAAQV